MRRYRLAFHMAGAVLAVPALAAAAPNKAKVSLHWAVAGVAPGTNFEVAFQFEIEKEWHIYWKNAGDSGMPPRVSWNLPAGFEVGELRFPAPKLYEDAAGLRTHILEDSPILLQTLTAPDDLKPGAKVKLEADLTWLVCQKLCLMEKGKVSAELPVVRGAAEVKPANETLFKRARALLPVPADKAKYVKLAAAPSVKGVTPGERFEVLLDLAVAEGHHIQSHKPNQPEFIGTRVFVESPPELDFGDIQYPPGEERTHPQLGKVSEYRGKLQLRVPAQVLEDAAGTKVRAAGLVTTQACNDRTGVCYPPEHVEWSVELPLTGAAEAAEPDGTLVADRDQPAEPAGEPTESREAQVADAQAVGDPGGSSDGGGIEGFLSRLGTGGLLLACFLYGLFINATPCVLPLLSIKVLGFVKQAHESRGKTAALGLAFGLGVMIFFVVLGFLASTGQNILQFPIAVIALGAIVMALALSMLGVYTLQVPTAATKLDATIRQEGLLASFGKGALAPVLGFACTGPLLAGAFGWATQQPPRLALFAFLFTGLGMASPYILLGANPKWLSFLPKPGQWMVTFERIMGFLLLGMVIWLLHPLTAQIGVTGFEWTLGFLVVVAMACWIWGKVDFNMTTLERLRYRGGALALVGAAALVVFGWIHPLSEPPAGIPIASTDWSRGVPWQPWSREAVAEAVESGKTVFVDFTAAYCTQCKANKLIAIETDEARAKMQALGVVPFQGDFTRGDQEIFETLKSFSRAGVPLNLIYPAGKPNHPIVLDPAITKDYLLRKLDEAGPSRDGGRMASARRQGA